MQLANALLLLIIFSSTLSPHPASFQFWQALSNCLVILLNLLQDSLFFFFIIFHCLCHFFFFFNLLLRGYHLLQIVADKQVLMHEKSHTCSEERSNSVRALFLVVFIYKSFSSCSPLHFYFFSFYYIYTHETISISPFPSCPRRRFFHLCHIWVSRQSFISHGCKKVIVPLSANHSNTWFIIIALQREISLERSGWS